MNRLTRRCLAVFVSAICVKYSAYANKTIAYGAETNNIETTDNNSDSTELSSVENPEIVSSTDDNSTSISNETPLQDTSNTLQEESITDDSSSTSTDETGQIDVTIDSISQDTTSSSNDSSIAQTVISSEEAEETVSSEKEETDNVDSYFEAGIEIPDDLTDTEKAVLKINYGIAEVSDYTLIGIKTVNDINVDIVNEKIKQLRDENGTDFTQTQVKTKVNSVIKASLTSIRSGAGQIIDYLTAGVDTVNDKNLEDVNFYLKGKACTTGDKVKTYVEKILTALSNVNKGEGDKSSYQLIGIYNLDASSIPAINEGVVKAREAKGDDLTRTEIIEVKDQILSQINQAFEDINNGTAQIESYVLIGIEDGVVNDDNLAEINEYLQGKKAYTLDSVRSNIDKILGYIQRINDGCETVNDYREIGIQDVTEDSLDKIRSLIAVKKLEKGSNLNKAEIEEVVTNALTNAENSFDSINEGNASVADYQALGITEVTEDNLDDVNNTIKGYGVTSISEVRDVICPVIRSLNNINSGNDTEDDYVMLGIDSFDNANIDAVREVIKSREKYLDIAAITDAVDEANSIVNFFDILNSTGASVSDYENIGAVRVEEYNLADINTALKNQNYKTLKRVQEAIDAVALPLARINEGSEDFADYSSLSIYGVTEANIATVRSEIQKAKGVYGRNLSIAEVKTAITSADRILEAFDNMNNGIAKLEDFDVIGVTGVTSDNLPYINDELMGQGLSDAAKVKEVVNNVNRTLKAYANINAGDASLEDYEWIGAEGVTEDNRKYVNRAVRGQDCETVDEVQDIINTVLEERAIFDKVNAGTAVVSDYTRIGVTGVTEANKPYVDRVLIGKGYFTSEEVQADVNTVVGERNAFAKINEGTAEVSDYETVGVTGVTEANRIFVNSKVKGKGYTETADLQAAVDAVVKLYNAFDAINKGTESLADFDTIGVTGVTEANKAYVDRILTGKGCFTAEEVQKVVNTVIAERSSFAKINEGTAELSDYDTVGVTGVTEANNDFVNSKVKGKGYTETADLQAAVDAAVKLYNAFVAINNGSEILPDFDTIGVTGATDTNLKYIISYTKGKGYFTSEEVQAAVDKAIVQNDTFAKINEGTAEIPDYETVGVTGVTEANKDFVNEKVKGKGYTDTVDLQAAVTDAVNLYEAFMRINSGDAKPADFELIGVDGVTEDIISFANEAFTDDDEVYLDTDDVQGIIDDVIDVKNAIDEIIAGTAIRVDYVIAGLDIPEDDDALDFINKHMTGRTDCITVEATQTAIDGIVELFDAFTAINDGSAEIEDFNTVSVTGVTEANLPYVLRETKGKGYLTTEEVQAVVDKVAGERTAFDKINSGNGEVSDYETVNVTGVTEDNKSFVNEKVKGQGFTETDPLQNAVNDAVKLYNAFDAINKGNGQISDYETLGITVVTEANKDFVNSKVQGQNIFEKSTLESAVADAVKLYNAFDAINKGTESLEDFDTIGVTGVTESNKTYADRVLTGKGYFTAEEVQAVVNEVCSQRGALVRINAGEGTLEDYQLIGASNVTSANRDYVNAGMAGSSFTEIDDALAKINSIVRVYDAYYRINKGRATVEDYEVIGVTGVDSYSLLYVNVNLRNKKYNTTEQVQARVDMVLETYQETIKVCKILDMINDGTASAEDYDYIGIDGVTEDNVSAVNAALKGQGLEDLDEIQNAVDSVVNA